MLPDMLRTKADEFATFARRIAGEHARAAGYLTEFANLAREGADILDAAPFLIDDAERGRPLDLLYEVSRMGALLVRRAMLGEGTDLWAQAEHHRAWAARAIEQARTLQAVPTPQGGRAVTEPTPEQFAGVALEAHVASRQLRRLIGRMRALDLESIPGALDQLASTVVLVQGIASSTAAGTGNPALLAEATGRSGRTGAPIPSTRANLPYAGLTATEIADRLEHLGPGTHMVAAAAMLESAAATFDSPELAFPLQEFLVARGAVEDAERRGHDTTVSWETLRIAAARLAAVVRTHGDCPVRYS